MSSIKALSGANPNKGLIVSLNTLIPAKITIKETIVPIIPSTGKSVINVSIKETSVANVVTTSFKLSCPAAFKDDESIFLPIWLLK